MFDTIYFSSLLLFIWESCQLPPRSGLVFRNYVASFPISEKKDFVMVFYLNSRLFLAGHRHFFLLSFQDKSIFFSAYIYFFLSSPHFLLLRGMIGSSEPAPLNAWLWQIRVCRLSAEWTRGVSRFLLKAKKNEPKKRQLTIHRLLLLLLLFRIGSILRINTLIDIKLLPIGRLARTVRAHII